MKNLIIIFLLLLSSCDPFGVDKPMPDTWHVGDTITITRSYRPDGKYTNLDIKRGVLVKISPDRKHFIFDMNGELTKHKFHRYLHKNVRIDQEEVKKSMENW